MQFLESETGPKQDLPLQQSGKLTIGILISVPTLFKKKFELKKAVILESLVFFRSEL